MGAPAHMHTVFCPGYTSGVPEDPLLIEGSQKPFEHPQTVAHVGPVEIDDTIQQCTNTTGKLQMTKVDIDPGFTSMTAQLHMHVWL